MRAALLYLPLILAACVVRVETVFTGRDSSATVSVGERFELRLSSPVGTAPEYQSSWGEAVLDGEAIRFLSRKLQRPPAGVDGGSVKTIYTFEALAPGDALIEVPRTDSLGKPKLPSHRLSLRVEPD